MKKSLLYMIVLAVILVLPTRATDVGKLRPVQSVAVYKTDKECIIVTDTNDVGRGENVLSAIDNLKATTPATIYLDTAQYLIVDEVTVIEDLRPYLKGDVRLCRFVGKPQLEAVSGFLAAHPKGPSIGQWRTGDDLPLLDCTGERLIFK